MICDPETVNAFQDLPIDWEPAPMPPDWVPDDNTPSVFDYPY